MEKGGERRKVKVEATGVFSYLTFSLSLSLSFSHSSLILSLPLFSSSQSLHCLRGQEFTTLSQVFEGP